MRNFMRQTNGVYDVAPGAHIESTIREAIELATKRACTITFVFNNVTVSVRSDSDPKHALRDYWQAIARIR